MKKLFTLLSILCIVLCATACNEEKGTNQSWNTPILSNSETQKRDYNELILGKWYFTNDGEVDTESYITFFSDGTAEQVYKGRTDRVMYGKWSIKGNIFTFTSYDNESSGNYVEITDITTSEFTGKEFDMDGNRTGSICLVRGH